MSRMLGYALGLITFLRGDYEPSWLWACCPDLRANVRQAVHSLRLNGLDEPELRQICRPAAQAYRR